MAWSTPLTAVSNATLTAAQWNASVRDNLLTTAPALASSAGGYFVATGTNTIVQRLPSAAVVLTSETTSSTSFVDLATAGPAVTVTTGARALIVVTTQVQNSVAGNNANMSYAISGATTRAADVTYGIIHRGGGGSQDTVCASFCHYVTDLTAGSNTFTTKYSVGGGTATFNYRRIFVMPY